MQNSVVRTVEPAMLMSSTAQLKKLKASIVKKIMHCSKTAVST